MGMRNNITHVAGSFSADGASIEFNLFGGRYVLQVNGSFGGGNIGVSILLPDGVTFIRMGTQGGVATDLTTSGSSVMYLGPGRARISLTGSAGPSVQYSFSEANGG